jgi:aconitate hydratase
MGVLPLQFLPGESAASLGLRGDEVIDVIGLDDGRARLAAVRAVRADGSSVEFQTQVLLLTPKEVEYFRHGGLLHYVLRQLARQG